MVVYFDCFLVLDIVINAEMNMGGGAQRYFWGSDLIFFW